MTSVDHEGRVDIRLGLLHRFGSSLDVLGAVVGSVGSTSENDVDVLVGRREVSLSVTMGGRREGRATQALPLLRARWKARRTEFPAVLTMAAIPESRKRGGRVRICEKEKRREAAEGSKTHLARSFPRTREGARTLA